MKEFLSGLTLGTIIALTTLLIVSVAIAQPNPGHSADQIGPGTFQGGGDYIFPSSSNVVMSDSGIYLRTDKFHGIKWSYNTNGFDGPTIFGWSGISIEKRNTTGNYSIANFTFNEVSIATNLRLPHYKKLYLGDAYIYGAKAFDINYFYTPDMFFIGKTLGVNGSTFYVDSNTGRVGVGTTSPEWKLDVNGNAQIRGNYLRIGNGNPRAYVYADANNMVFTLPGGDEEFHFKDKDGNILLRIGGEGAKLEISQTSTQPVIKWKASGGREYGIEPYDNRFILADLGVRRILEADPAGWTVLWGNIGIEDPTPDAKLDVSGGDIYVDSGKGLRSETGDLIIDAHATGRGTVYMYDDVSISSNLNVGGDVKWGTKRGILSVDQGASIELGGTGKPYIDFSNDATTDYDARIQLTGDNELALDVQGGSLTVKAWTLRHEGADFVLGTNDGRSIGSNTGQRALVHDNNDVLVLNYAGDFEGGVRVDSKIDMNGHRIVNQWHRYYETTSAWEVTTCDSYSDDPDMDTGYSLPAGTYLVIYNGRWWCRDPDWNPPWNMDNCHGYGYVGLEKNADLIAVSRRGIESPTGAGGGWESQFTVVAVVTVATGDQINGVAKWCPEDNEYMKLAERTMIVIPL